jgi:O-succinylbenzoate synthase
VLKVAPLGGVSELLNIARQIEIPIVVSSALDSAVGIGQGLLAAAALPELEYACGLGTAGLFVEDIVEPVAPVDGYLQVRLAIPDPARLAALTAAPDRRDWWIERVIACYRLLS